MLPLAVLLAVLVSLSAPLAYFTLTAGTLRTRAHATAAQVAAAIGREIQARPVLWRYDDSNLLAQIQAHTDQPGIARIEVVDRTGVRVPLDPARPIAPSVDLLWESAPIAINEQVVGHVWAGARLADARAGALLLLLPFGVLGVGLAALVFFIPGRAISRAERRIANLITRLEHSQAALAGFNQTLEQQVAERSSELRAKEQHLRELSSRAVLLQEAERRVIARELHDSAGQALTAIRINLQIIAQLAERHTSNDRIAGLADPHPHDRRRDPRGDPPRRQHAGPGDPRRRRPRRRDPAPVRRLRRALRPPHRRELPELPQRGLTAAIESTCYRVAQEALTNVARHAQATRVRVSPHPRPAAVHLEIADNGQGFDPARDPGVPPGDAASSACANASNCSAEPSASPAIPAAAPRSPSTSRRSR
jgi:hypothetical protein